MITKADFTDHGYDVEELDDRIFLVRNFLPSGMLEEVRAQLSTFNEEEWLGYYMKHLEDRAEIEHGTRDVEKLVTAGLMEVTYSWADKNIPIGLQHVTQTLNERLEAVLDGHPDLTFNGFGTVQRQYEGAELKPHVDSHSDPLVAYAAVVYITDDYTAGELYFPTRSLEVKPEAGSLILFPGTNGYEHGVKAPGPGPTRYVFPAFIHSKL